MNCCRLWPMLVGTMTEVKMPMICIGLVIVMVCFVICIFQFSIYCIGICIYIIIHLPCFPCFIRNCSIDGAACKDTYDEINLEEIKA